MKRSRYLFFLVCIFALTFLLSSSRYERPISSIYLPVYMKRADMENAVKLETPGKLVAPGKIFIHNNYILINEKYKGIHFIDNTNPESPKNIAFMRIDGCVDMAMKDDMLYADNAVDLIAIKMSADYKTATVTGRIKNIFPEIQSPDRLWNTSHVEEFRPKEGVLVAWKLRNNN